MKITFSLQGRPFVALCDLLKLTGIADSGGHAKTLIAQGLVQRQSQVETRKTAKITAGECISCQGQQIHVQT